LRLIKLVQTLLYSIQLEKKINTDLKIKNEPKRMKIYLITRECEGINFS